MAIGYTPQTWVNGSAPALSAANLQTMDNGINAACDALDAMGATATPTASKVPIADGSGKLDGWITDATTAAKGKVQLAADDGTTASTAVQATDSRLAQATESHRGTAELATAAEIVTGTDTGRVPNVANLKTALASNGMWLTKRTKMPDGATALYSQDAWATADGWEQGGGATLSVSGGSLIFQKTGANQYFQKASLKACSGKTVLARMRLTAGTPDTTVITFGNAATCTTTASISTAWTVVQAVFNAKTDLETYPVVYLGTLGSSNTYTLEIDWLWIGDLDATTKQLYTVGTLSEEAARIADQLGDSAGVGVAAVGTINGVSTPFISENDTVTIAGKTYKWVTTPAVEGDVKWDNTNNANSLSFLRRAINYTGKPGTDYVCAAAHPLVLADYLNYVVTITAKQEGLAGNTITLAKSAATLTLSGTTLSGGYSDAAAKIITAIGNNIAGGGTRPAAAKIDITSTSLIGYEQAVDVASGGTTTLPAGGTLVWFVYGHGATISSAKRGSSAGGTTLTVAGANATVWYRRYA